MYICKLYECIGYLNQIIDGFMNININIIGLNFM